MAMRQANSPLKVTHVVPDDPLIKIFTTSDPAGLNLIDRILENYNERIQRNLVSSPNDVNPDSIVLVPRFHKYRRAKVLSAEDRTRIVHVRFVDIGGTARFNIYDVRTIDPEIKIHLNTMPEGPGLSEYILGGALKSRDWTDKDLECVNALTLIPQDRIQLNVVGALANRSLVNISFIAGDNFITFASFLANKNYAINASLEQIKSALHGKYGPPYQMPSQVPPGFPPMSVPNVMAPTLPFSYSQPPQPILPTPVPSGFPAYGIRPTMTTSLPTPRLRGPRQLQPQPTEPAPQPIPQAFTSETLPVGSTYEVYVSYIIDGVQNFTVQLKSKVVETLTPLMIALNDSPAEPFTDPLQPGTICLGRYSNDNALCRAVVSTVLAEGANLYFVDFGNSEIVPFNEIYKIRPEFIREKMMAIRFSLTGVADDFLLTTKDAVEIFQHLTEDATLPITLKVMKPETPLRQFCELFLNIDGKLVNVKNKIKDKMRVLQPANYQRIGFKKGTQADVIISYVESPSRFFVQLTLNEVQLNTIMAAIKRYCASSENKEVLYSEDVNEEMSVCAKYSEDGEWYRAVVVQEPDPTSGLVDVLFVDYGNQETVHFSELRMMTNEMIALGPMQAVECRLDIDAELSVRADVIAYFTKLLEGNEYAMNVLNVLPAKVLLVDLVDKTSNDDLKTVLRERFASAPQRESPQGDTRGLKMNSKSTTNVPQNTSNWRQRQNSTSGDNDFSAFKSYSKANNHVAADETDNVKTDSFERRDRYSSRDSGPRRFEKNDSEQSDTWRKPRHEDTTPPWNNHDNRWSEHDDRTTRNDRDSSANRWPNRDHENGEGGRWPSRDNSSGGGFRSSRGRDNDRDEGGGRSYNREGGDRWANRGGDSWNNNRGGDGRGSERKPFQKREDSWNTDSSKQNTGSDGWKSNKVDDSTAVNDGWSTENRRDGDRDSKPWNDRGGGFNDRSRGGDRDSKPWNNSKGGSFNDGGRSGDRDSKPWGDRGGGFREKRDFGDNSWKNNSTAGSGGWETPTTPSLQPAYERGAQFVESDHQPGETMEVVVTWFVNPVQFYVMPVDNQDFRAMMETLQADYSRREPIDLNTLSPNECIVARDKDDVIYRARFLRARPGGALVTFVDYGNIASVKKDCAWTVSSEHCSIPIQALCCKLYDVSTADKDTPWSVVQGVDTHFESDKFTLTFIECIEENGSKTWSVNLENTDHADVGSLLVENGLAVRQNVLKSEELYDISLLKHQVLAVFPGAVISSKKFFVHMEPHHAEIISQQITELSANPENLLPLSSENAIEGEFCLSLSEDEEYFRALILSVDHVTENAHIVFIDYGDESDVALNSLKVLPDYLRVWNAQIMECCLYGEDLENEEEFKTAVSDNDLIIKVMDVVDNKLLVILYDVKGSRLPYPTAVEETVPPLCPLPVLRASESVVITHIEKDKVYIQRAADEKDILLFDNELSEFYDTQEVEKVNPEVGKFYAAKSAKFEAWYRCRPTNDECKEVFYIDYGNSEAVSELISIKLLDEKFFVSPMYCVGVSTNALFTADDLTPLIEVVHDYSFRITIKSVGPCEWYGDLVCESTSKTLTDYAVETSLGEAISSSEEKQNAYTAFTSWKLGEEENVRVSHVDSPDMIYLQSVVDQPKLTILQDELQSSLTRILPLLGPYEEMMAGQNPIDRKWYRVRPLSKDEFFAFDFGFTLKSPVLKKLPTYFKMDESTYAVACSLNLQPTEGTWSAKVSAQLSDLVTKAENVTAKLEYVKHRMKFVDIKADSTSVSDMLVSDGVAAYRSNEVIVSHANSLNDFYIQYKEDEEEIYNLAEKIQEANSWDTIEPEIGQIFAAQFSDDEQWYRAVLVNGENEDVDCKLVQFVDYGNESSSNQFKALPEDLKTLPPFAIQAQLNPMPDNADELHDLFTQFCTTAEGYFLAYVINGDPMMVMLEHNGKMINELLTEKKTLLEWKLQPAEVGDKVVVSHINSPSSFYIRSETADLDDVEVALSAVENMEPLTEIAVDDILAAKYPEDELWYRAKVVNVVEGNTTVLFFDYGNQSEVTELRALPDGAKLTACSAKHCSIPVPDELAEWPDVASTRFAELTCDGNTVFEITIKEDGDPALVDLHDNGTSVAEELATICKADLTAPTRKVTKEIVVLSHVDNLNAIWIQYQSPQLDEMSNEMVNVETFDNLEIANVGMLVAGQYEEEWYRASVVETTEDNSCKVLFIDYGNEAVASLMKSLPADLANLPPLAKCCRLKDKVPTDTETSALEKLREFVTEGRTFYVDELDESTGQPVVSLTSCYDGKTLSELILNVDESKEVCENEKEISGHALNSEEASNEKQPNDILENVKTEETSDGVLKSEEARNGKMPDDILENVETEENTPQNINDVEDVIEPLPSSDMKLVIDDVTRTLISEASLNVEEDLKHDVNPEEPFEEQTIECSVNIDECMDNSMKVAVIENNTESGDIAITDEDVDVATRASEHDTGAVEAVVTESFSYNKNSVEELKDEHETTTLPVGAEEPINYKEFSEIQAGPVKSEDNSDDMISEKLLVDGNENIDSVGKEELPSTTDKSSPNLSVPVDENALSIHQDNTDSIHDDVTLENRCNDIPQEEENDAFRTPPCRSMEMFSTPEGLLDMSSASTEVLGRSDSDDCPLTQTVVDHDSNTATEALSPECSLPETNEYVSQVVQADVIQAEKVIEESTSSEP